MALQNYLKTRTDRPLLIEAGAKRKRGEGTVKATLKEGEVFLKRGDQVYRLTYNSKDSGRGRHLPPGEYTLFGYRIVNGNWHTSATGGHSKVLIRKGKTTKLKLNSAIRIQVRAQRKGQGVSLRMGIGGDKVNGLSIYRDGKRVPIEYRLQLDGNSPPATGTMNYG
ncbi:MAG: hypothetical protein JKY65_06935 [Planctomycetes bacterium]|nr:hypothetical protein [Planctomycetota bacterium]